MKNILIFMFILVVGTVKSQKMSFDIFTMGKQVGEVVLVKKNLGDGKYTLDYTFDAEVKVLFIKTVVDMDIDITFTNNQLTEAFLKYKYNEKLLTRKFTWDGQKYTVDTNGKKTTFDKKVFFSVMNMYEKEPIGIKEVFLEKQNEFAALKNLGNNKYSVVVDGDNCIYTYKNGLLESIFIDAIVDLNIVRRK